MPRSNSHDVPGCDSLQGFALARLHRPQCGLIVCRDRGGRAMAKGYWVVFADVSDPEGYREYVAANGKALARFGARFLARGGRTEPQEGEPRSRVVVLEFPS